jgi:hypothetical protein
MDMQKRPIMVKVSEKVMRVGSPLASSNPNG